MVNWGSAFSGDPGGDSGSSDDGGDDGGDVDVGGGPDPGDVTVDIDGGDDGGGGGGGGSAPAPSGPIGGREESAPGEGDEVNEATDPDTGDTTTDRLRDDAESDPMNPQTETTDVGGSTDQSGRISTPNYTGGGEEPPSPDDVQTDPGGGGSVDEGEGGVDLDTGFPSPDTGQDQPPGGGPETIQDPAPVPEDDPQPPGGGPETIADPAPPPSDGPTTPPPEDINERISQPNHPDPNDTRDVIEEPDPSQEDITEVQLETALSEAREEYPEAEGFSITREPGSPQVLNIEAQFGGGRTETAQINLSPIAVGEAISTARTDALRRGETQLEEELGRDVDPNRDLTIEDGQVILTETGEALVRDVQTARADAEEDTPSGADISIPAGGFEGTRGGTPGGTLDLAPWEYLPGSEGTEIGELFPSGTETETIGESGPFGVTIPSDTATARGERTPTTEAFLGALQLEETDTINPGLAAVDPREFARPRPTDERFSVPTGPPTVTDDPATVTEDVGRFVAGLDDPVTGPAGPRDVPEGAPGVGVGSQPGGATPAEAQAFVDDIINQLQQPVTGPAGPRDIPEGAPGAGVGIAQGAPPDLPTVVTETRRSVESFLTGLGEPVTGPTGPRDAPDTAPGGSERPGLGTFPQQVEAFLEPGDRPARRESQVDVPEGAPGSGVGEGTGTVEDFTRLRQQVAESLAVGETVDATPPADAPEVVGAAGPLGVTAPQDQLAGDDVRRNVRATRRALEGFAGGLDDPVTGPTGPREVPEGAPGVGVPVTDGPSEFPTAQTVVDQTTSAVGEATEPLADRLSTPQPTVNIGRAIDRDIATTVVTTEEAEDINEAPEQFGDWDPQAGGVAIEPTLERASAGFRDVTGGAADRATAAAGLEPGSFEDRTAETFIETFPELFNAPGLAAETLEIGEAVDYVAADPGERGPEIGRAGAAAARRGVDYLSRNPGVAAGGGLAILAQLPTSLATLRGLRAVHPTLARAQDVVWNTPERVARRSLDLTDETEGAFDEVGRLRDDILDRADAVPGVDRRTLAFGGGEGPGQVTELRLGGRTVARTETDAPETGGATRRLEEAQGRFSPDPDMAEIETRPDYSLFDDRAFGGLVRPWETEAGVLGEGAGDRLGGTEEATEPVIGFDEMAAPSVGADSIVSPLEGIATDIETRLDIETELGLEQDVELETETETELRLDLETEFETEQEQETEFETELEFETEGDLVDFPELPGDDERRRRRETDPWVVREERGLLNPFTGK